MKKKCLYDLITILGPTASGKTVLSAKLAAELNGEIISADSRQVYRRMDLGTGKDLDDYVINGKKIPYHLIDIVEPGTKYNVFAYQRDFLKAYKKVCTKGRMPILCGGSGLYLESVLRGYRLLPVPENKKLRSQLEGKSIDELTQILSSYKPLHNTSDIDTPKRAIRAIEIEDYYINGEPEKQSFPTLSSLNIGIWIERDARWERIKRRLKQRLESGMIEEIRGLLDSGIQPEDLLYYGLEYKFVTLYVTGQISYDEMFTKLEIAIRQFAKRQMTWFRGMERRGILIHWLDASMPLDEKILQISRFLK